MKQLKSHKSFGGTTEIYEHDSQVTGTKMKFSLIRPGKKVNSGLIWLSGLTCTEENFITKAGAQKIANELGIAIVCPDTSPRGLDLPGEHESYDFGSGAGFYLSATTENYSKNYKMDEYINSEIYEWFDKEFNFDGKIGIFGHSMGGHGALTLGLKNTNLYKSVSAFAPIVNPMSCDWGKKAFRGYLGDNEKSWAQYDACSLVSEGKTHPNEVLVDQGLSDDFYPQQLLTENWSKACEVGGQKTQVRMQEGYDHSYYFISTFLEDHLKHHAKLLN